MYLSPEKDIVHLYHIFHQIINKLYSDLFGVGTELQCFIHFLHFFF